MIEVNTDRKVYTGMDFTWSVEYTWTSKAKKTAVKITNEVKDILCWEKLKPIKLKWEDVIDAAEQRMRMEKVKENYQGAAKKKNGEPREQEHGILKNNKMNHPQKEYVQYLPI